MRWVGATHDQSAAQTAQGRPRVLVLTRYGRLSPTTRVRFLQFIEQFERDGDDPLEFDPKLNQSVMEDPEAVLKRLKEKDGK